MHRIATASLLLLAACADGLHADPTPTPTPTPHVSSGLKIFLTSREHVADFKNDPNLNGDSAIHKADDFCNTDPTAPTRRYTRRSSWTA